MGMGDQRHARAILISGERLGSRCIGRWVGRVDECGKYRPRTVQKVTESRSYKICLNMQFRILVFMIFEVTSL